MQVRDSYDLIVIGDQLSGLFLAAGAAQAGKKVLVLEESSVPTVSYEIPSGRFLGDFVAEPLIGLREGSPADSFLRSLGLYQKLDDLFPFHEPPLQIAGKGYRFDFEGDPNVLGEELRREFPANAEALQKLLTGAVPQTSSFSRAVADLGLPVEWELFGWMQTALYGSIASLGLSYPAYKEVVSMASRSVRFPFGGRSALKERLLSRINVFGGNMKRSTRVEEIVFERGRLAGVLLSSYEGFVRSPMVVGAMGAKTFFDLVPSEFRNAKLAEAVKSIHPRFWRLSFTLLVPDSLIPEGLGSHLALVDAGEFIQLQVFSKDAYGGIPLRHKAVVVRTLVPFEASSLSERSIGRHLKKSLARLESIFPFLREAPFIASPDAADLAHDPVFQRYYRFQDLDFIPPSFLAFEAGLSTSLDQRDFLDWDKFGLPGLALCSRDVYPLFGTTGEILAAMDLLAVMRKRQERQRA